MHVQQSYLFTIQCWLIFTPLNDTDAICNYQWLVYEWKTLSIIHVSHKEVQSCCDSNMGFTASKSENTKLIQHSLSMFDWSEGNLCLPRSLTREWHQNDSEPWVPDSTYSIPRSFSRSFQSIYANSTVNLREPITRKRALVFASNYNFLSQSQREINVLKASHYYANCTAKRVSIFVLGAVIVEITNSVLSFISEMRKPLWKFQKLFLPFMTQMN